MNLLNKNKIYFLVYNDNIYIKKNKNIINIPLENNIIKNGRVNNVKKLISNLKKCKLVKDSFFKIISDSYVFIYFSNYNDYEINNIKNDFQDNGIERIKLVDYHKLIKDESLILFSNGYYYVTVSNLKYITPNLDCITKYTNSKIIADKNSWVEMCKNGLKAPIYMVDNLPRYLLKRIC